MIGLRVSSTCWFLCLLLCGEAPLWRSDLSSLMFPFVSFFLLLRLDNLIWPAFKFTDYPKSVVEPFLWFFFSPSSCTFSSKTLAPFNHFSHFIDLLSVSYDSLPVVSFSPFSVFKMRDLSSCPVRPVSVFSGTLSFKFPLYQFMYHYLLFSTCFAIFCWKLDILNNMIWKKKGTRNRCHLGPDSLTLPGQVPSLAADSSASAFSSSEVTPLFLGLFWADVLPWGCTWLLGYPTCVIIAF